MGSTGIVREVLRQQGFGEFDFNYWSMDVRALGLTDLESHTQAPRGTTVAIRCGSTVAMHVHYEDMLNAFA